ncbi:MAG: hypothetical protein R3C26_07255 [Calditrichia bacterium]
MILFKFNRIKHFVIALTGLLLIISCERDSTSTGPDQTVLPSITGAFIINEGNFLQGNASIDFYNADSEKFSTIYLTPQTALRPAMWLTAWSSTIRWDILWSTIPIKLR